MKPVIVKSTGHFRPESTFKPGQTVLIPKGVKVHSTHPARKNYITARAQKVKIHHCMLGQFVSVDQALHEYRPRLEEEGFDLSILEQWKTQNAPELHEYLVQVKPPAVCWAGSGGYWCEAPESAVKSVVDL